MSFICVQDRELLSNKDVRSAVKSFRYSWFKHRSVTIYTKTCSASSVWSLRSLLVG